MKQCTECGELKDESEFWRVRRGNGGALRARCRDCCTHDPHDHSGDTKPAGRVCTVCSEWKPLTEFHKHKICRYGVEPMCKLCKYQRRKERDSRDPDRIRKMDLKAKYGLSLEDYEAMLLAQEGRCAICGVADEKLVVDHNHATGRVRSLLCHLCNAMIGCARESAEILVSAAAYLHAEQHPELGRIRAEVAYVAYIEEAEREVVAALSR